jgi:hypothetical protein
MNIISVKLLPSRSYHSHNAVVAETFLVYLFIRFARISYGRFIAISYKFKLSTYIQEPMVTGRRVCTQREI